MAHSPVLTTPTISYTEQLACARRELRLRQSNYPNWVKQGKMTQAWMDVQIAAMAAAARGAV